MAGLHDRVPRRASSLVCWLSFRCQLDQANQQSRGHSSLCSDVLSPIDSPVAAQRIIHCPEACSLIVCFDGRSCGCPSCSRHSSFWFRLVLAFRDPKHPISNLDDHSVLPIDLFDTANDRWFVCIRAKLQSHNERDSWIICNGQGVWCHPLSRRFSHCQFTPKAVD